MRKAAIVRALLCAAVFAAPAMAEPVPGVDQLCAAARKRADASPDKARIFVAISTPAGTPGSVAYDGQWHVVPTRPALEALVAGVAEVAAYDEAFVWDLPGNSLVVTTFATSSSGDWGHFVDYCFRADGTLALTRSTLNTSNGPDGAVRRIRERRFSRSGALLWTTTRVLDLVSGKVRRNPQFMDQDEPIFKTRALLPFAQLL